MVHGPVRCQFRSHMTPISTSVIYPELPDPLTPGDLQQLFSPSFDERQWAPTVVRLFSSGAGPAHAAGQDQRAPSTDGNGRFDPVQRLDEALMIAEFVLSCMPSVPADKLGIGAAWGRIRHLWHTSCRSRARRGRTIMRHCSEPSHNVRKTQL